MIWRMIGLLAVGIGAIGLVLSLYAGINTWSVANQIENATDETLNHMQAIVEPVHRQSEAAVTVVEASRERLDSIQTSVERLASADDPEQPEATSILETLDQHVIRRLDAAEEFIRTMQANMRNASNALILLDSLPFFSPRLASNIDQRESQLRSLATSLTEISDLLEQVTQTFVEVRSQSSIEPKQLELLQNTLTQVDSGLDELESEVHRFSEGIGRVQAILTDLRRNAPARIKRLAALATVFFVCFGCSQLSLLAHGYRLIRPRRHAD